MHNIIGASAPLPDDTSALHKRIAELSAELERLKEQRSSAAEERPEVVARAASATAAHARSLSFDNAELRAENAELKHDRDAARSGEHRLTMILDSAIDHAIITLSLDGVITGWNPGAYNITGWEAQEAIGQAGALIFTPEDREAGAPEQEMREALDEGVSVDERWHIKKDGSRFWASGLLMLLRNGKLQGYLKILRDRTGQRNAEEALKQQSELTQTIADSAADAMFLMDKKGHTTFANPAAISLFGWSQQELLGRPLHDLVHYRHPDGRPFPMHECPLGEVISSGRTLKAHEDTFYRKDGSEFQ